MLIIETYGVWFQLHTSSVVRQNIGQGCNPLQKCTTTHQSLCSSTINAREIVETQNPDVFEKVTWGSSPMQFWQNQFDFAVRCATTVSGVCWRLPAAVLMQLSCILPDEPHLGCHKMKHSMLGTNHIPSGGMKESAMSSVSLHTLIGRSVAQTKGLGKSTTTGPTKGYHMVGGGEYDSIRMSFTKKTTSSCFHISLIKQGNPAVEGAWRSFFLPKSKGFTCPGVERPNDSIRTYVWAILGAQAQTHTGIVGTGTAFDAQKQFLAKVNDTISYPVDLPLAISHYRDALQYAGSEVNLLRDWPHTWPQATCYSTLAMWWATTTWS